MFVLVALLMLITVCSTKSLAPRCAFVLRLCIGTATAGTAIKCGRMIAKTAAVIDFLAESCFALGIVFARGSLETTSCTCLHVCSTLHKTPSYAVTVSM
jgi:hypothetical protein